MTLRQDEWAVLEDLAGHDVDNWIAGTQLPGKQSRARSITRGLAEHGLCELAGDDVLDALATDSARSNWAARITQFGRTALAFRALQAKPEPQPEPAPGPTRIQVRGTSMDTLQTALAAAEAGTLPGINAAALRNALAGSRPVPGSRQHTMNPTDSELATIHTVLHLESLARDATGYHHLMRQLPFGFTFPKA
ncbi:hypothetical protein ABZW10_37455 [Kitasatospora sp. NPDC004723]|uniref:hypothetical protein n=1 Tax=Kitasatospora sp. NPDC004723 TaxID=3154288 RepID=UPI0033A26DD8